MSYEKNKTVYFNFKGIYFICIYFQHIFYTWNVIVQEIKQRQLLIFLK